MMSDNIKDQEEVSRFRSSMCNCEDCRGGVNEAERAVLMGESNRLVAEALASTPGRMDQPGDKESWASTLVAKALLEIEMARIDGLLAQGADPRVLQQMLTVRIVEAFGGAFASYLRDKVKGYQPLDFVLMATQLEEEDDETEDLFGDLMTQSRVEGGRRLH